MKLKLRDEKEYTCELTEELDKYLCGTTCLYKSYVLDTRDMFNRTIWSIRVPGCTVGYLEINKDGQILQAVIQSYALNRFRNNPNEMLKQFIGRTVEMERK